MTLLNWNQGSAGDKTQRGVVWVSYLLILGMFLCSIVLARSVPERSDVSGAGVGLTAFLLFAAAAAVGAGLGFLFGLPRARFTEADGGGTQRSTGGEHALGGTSAGATRSSQYLTNSNLIKVSDWLTTIIIGVGLVNVARLGPAAGDFSEALQAPLGGAPYAGTIGITVIIIALLASVILCYLWTSIRVRELLEESESNPHRDLPSRAELTVGDTATSTSTPGRPTDEISATSTPVP